MKAESIDDLLQSERGRKGFSREERAGLWKGIESSIGPILDPGSGTDPTTPPEAPAPPPGNGGGASDVVQGAKRLAASKIGALMAVAALGGAGLGAAAHARWAEPKIVVVERVAEPEPPIATAPLPPPSAALVTPAPEAPKPAPSAALSGGPLSGGPLSGGPLSGGPLSGGPLSGGPLSGGPLRGGALQPRAATSAAPSPRDPGLARERTLLDMARTALSRGDTASALTAIDSHAREFPASQLTEERELLAIQGLAAANRLPEARRRAATFRTNHPKSALLPIVEETTQ